MTRFILCHWRDEEDGTEHTELVNLECITKMFADAGENKMIYVDHTLDSGAVRQSFIECGDAHKELGSIARQINEIQPVVNVPLRFGLPLWR